MRAGVEGEGAGPLLLCVLRAPRWGGGGVRHPAGPRGPRGAGVGAPEPRGSLAGGPRGVRAPRASAASEPPRAPHRVTERSLLHAGAHVLRPGSLGIPGLMTLLVCFTVFVTPLSPCQPLFYRGIELV